MSTVGQRLKRLRKKINRTQAQVAKDLNMQRITYAQYEIDRREADYEALQKMANYYDCTTDYLLGITDDPSGDLKEVDQVDVKKVLQKEKAHWGGYEIPEEDKETIQRVLEAIIRREEEAATKES